MHSEFKFASPEMDLCLQWWDGVILALSPYCPFHLYPELQQSRVCRQAEVVAKVQWRRVRV